MGRGTEVREVHRYTTQNFPEEQHFWPGTEVQRYTAEKFSESATFLARYGGTEVHRSKFFRAATFLARYRGTQLNSFVVLLTILKKTLIFLTRYRGTRGTQVHVPRVPPYLAKNVAPLENFG